MMATSNQQTPGEASSRAIDGLALSVCIKLVYVEETTAANLGTDSRNCLFEHDPCKSAWRMNLATIPRELTCPWCGEPHRVVDVR